MIGRGQPDAGTHFQNRRFALKGQVEAKEAKRAKKAKLQAFLPFLPFLPLLLPSA
jgi:hypothetical protein